MGSCTETKRRLETGAELNPQYERIPDVACAVWPDHVLDVWLDSVVIGDVDGVAGFQHVLICRAFSAHRHHRVSMIAAEMADEISQQQLVAVAFRDYTLPDRAGKSHERKERNLLLRREGKTSPQTEIRVGIFGTSPNHLLPHCIETISVMLNPRSVKFGEVEIGVIAAQDV